MMTAKTTALTMTMMTTTTALDGDLDGNKDSVINYDHDEVDDSADDDDDDDAAAFDVDFN